MNLLTDPRIVNLFLGWRDAGFEAEVTLDGYVFKQTGFYSVADAYRWVCGKVAAHPRSTIRAA
jgi:hypothetical protein